NTLVNRIQKHGKNHYQSIYRAMNKIQQKTKTNPLSILRQAIRGVIPNIALKTKCIGESTHQLLATSRKCLGRNMTFKLSSKLVDAAKGSCETTCKKEETYRMAKGI
ncbi:hypothetical protein NMG60_11008556, partial [Bertholletia excelsa]